MTGLDLLQFIACRITINCDAVCESWMDRAAVLHSATMRATFPPVVIP